MRRPVCARCIFDGRYQILYGTSSRDADLKRIDFEVR